MSNKVKDLQQLAEVRGDATVMEWSTVSHTHGGNVQAFTGESPSVDMKDVASFVKQLQQLPNAAGDPTIMEWSTISHTHTKQ